MSLEAMQCTNGVGEAFGELTNQPNNSYQWTDITTGSNTTPVVGNCTIWPNNYSYSYSYPCYVYIDKTEKALKIAKLLYKGESIEKFLKMVEQIKEVLD